MFTLITMHQKKCWENLFSTPMNTVVKYRMEPVFQHWKRLIQLQLQSVFGSKQR